MAKDIEKLLSDVGLMPSESKVYLGALELGPATVQHIAQKARISRTAAYEAIELLQKRGLMSSSLSGKRRLFAAEDPHRIVSYLKGEQQRFASTLADIENVIGTLHLMSGGIKPAVKVYEGEEALPAYFDQLSKANPDAMYEISNLDDVYSHLDSDTIQASRKAVSWKNITTLRLLHRGTIRHRRDDVEYRELNASHGEFHGDISIYGDFVSLMTFIGRPVVVILESRSVADTMRTLFNAAWDSSRKA
jgi:sugar-specific transcriptional regulator TrmB